jgi:hypothetical protein
VTGLLAFLALTAIVAAAFAWARPTAPEPVLAEGDAPEATSVRHGPGVGYWLMVLLVLPLGGTALVLSGRLPMAVALMPVLAALSLAVMTGRLDVSPAVRVGWTIRGTVLALVATFVWFAGVLAYGLAACESTCIT